MNQWTGAVLLSLLPALTLGQSLAELARKEKERRKKLEGSGVKVRVLEVDGREEAARPITRSSSAVPAPSFSLDDRDGRRVSLADFRGRPLLLDFWATWCGPCRETMPFLEQVHRKHGARGLQVVAINIEGREKQVLDYLDSGGYSFSVLFDRGNWESLTAQSYGVSSIPRSFLIDRQGNIVYAGHPMALPKSLLEATLQ